MSTGRGSGTGIVREGPDTFCEAFGQMVYVLKCIIDGTAIDLDAQPGGGGSALIWQGQGGGQRSVRRPDGGLEVSNARRH